MDYKNQIEKFKLENQYRFLKNIEAIDEKYILYKTKKLINLASNDYLGISTNNNLYDSFITKLKQNKYKLSSTSSRLLSGNYEIYSKLEDLISKQYNKSALIYNSGYHANTGILPVLSTNKDLIIADKLIHASLIDGIKLSDADFKRFKHKDYQQLEIILKKERVKYKNVFIVSESIFSMDGDSADIQQLVELKQKFNTLLYIDEAHAIGVSGKNGLGICEEQNLINNIDIIVGTFGKAIASVGAFAALNQDAKEMLINKSRSLIYTTALPPINLEWTYFVLKKLNEFEKERENLKLLNKQIISLFKAKNINIDAENHIIPIITKTNENTLRIYNKLLESGYFVSAVRPPTVPVNTARIRLSLKSNLKINDFERLVNVFVLST